MDTLILRGSGSGDSKRGMGKGRRTNVWVVGYEKSVRMWNVVLGSVAEVWRPKFDVGRDGDAEEEEEEGRGRAGGLEKEIVSAGS